MFSNNRAEVREREREREREGEVYLSEGISLSYGIFNANIWIMTKCLIVIINVYLIFHCLFLIGLFLFVYRLMYSYLKLINLNRSFWFIEHTLIGTTASNQSRFGSNEN